ncbi:MAG: tRNA dimethylallyltransferase, partial [Polyangiaceae bacterium]
HGRPALHDRLRLVDPISANRLHPNDLVRVSRALEVFELSGVPLSTGHAEHALAAPRYVARVFAINRTSEDLTARIEERVRTWLESGWIEETEALLARGYGEARAMGSVGYREIRTYLGGGLPREELGATIVRGTRVFARRQRTWLRSAEVQWLGVQPDESEG